MPLVHHLVQGLLIVLVVFEIAVADSSPIHAASVVLRGVLGRVVDRDSSAHRHHSNVLCHVLLTREVVHILLVSERVFLVLLKPILDCAQLRPCHCCDLTEDGTHGPIFSLHSHAIKLFLHLSNDSLSPAADLVVDELDVLLTLREELHFLSQLLLLTLQVRELALPDLLVVHCSYECTHLLFVCLVGLLVVCVRPNHLASVFVRDLELTHHFLLRNILCLQFVVLLLILTDSKEERGVSLLLRHELLHDLTHVGVVRLVANGLEALLDMPVVLHLSTHSFLEKG
jgi:hypothetical protein